MNKAFEIIEACREDLPALLALYKELHETDPVPEGKGLDAVWDKIMGDSRLSHSPGEGRRRDRRERIA